MDRKPKPAPSAVETRLRYVGKHERWTYDINPKSREKREVPLQVHALVFGGRRGVRGTFSPTPSVRSRKFLLAAGVRHGQA
jgi:hypothetical protein